MNVFFLTPHGRRERIVFALLRIPLAISIAIVAVGIAVEEGVGWCRACLRR